jgi:23S rRNA-/tRNA-specific pseudouridylate synthase
VVGIASREITTVDRIAIVEEDPELSIIASTDEWIAVDKPAGIATQPALDRRSRSLEELLRVRYRDIYVVHRLDTPTSGVVVFARTTPSAARLSRLFATAAMRKFYFARIDGTLTEETVIDTPIADREALTIVRPLLGNLVEVEIKTGRTHQIRIHLASIGHAVIGDRRYGGSPSPRLMLHAWKLEHEAIGSLVAPPPPDFGPV